MGKFQFYHINEHYISYLHSIDTRVQYNKGSGVRMLELYSPSTALIIMFPLNPLSPITLTSKAAVLL